MKGKNPEKNRRKSRKQRRKQNTRRRYFRYGLFAAFSYLFFLIVTFPANIALSFVTDNPQLKKNLQLSGVTGTVWSGSADSVQFQGVNFGKLTWDLEILPILLGDISSYINFKNVSASGVGISGSGTIAVSLGGEIAISDFSAAFSVDDLAPFMYGMPARFSGNVRSHIEKMTLLQGQRINIKSRTVISNAALVSPQKIDYGNILLKSTPKSTGSRFELTDQGGPLILNGSINLKGNGVYTLNFGLGARDTASKDLSNGLRFLGQRDSTGKYRYKMNGKLQNW